MPQYDDRPITELTDAEFLAAEAAQNQHFREQIEELIRVSGQRHLKHNEPNPRSAYILHEIRCVGERCNQPILQLLDLKLRDGAACRVIRYRRGVPRDLIPEYVGPVERARLMRQRLRHNRFEWWFAPIPSDEEIKSDERRGMVVGSCKCHDYMFTIFDIVNRPATGALRGDT